MLTKHGTVEEGSGAVQHGGGNCRGLEKADGKRITESVLVTFDTQKLTTSFPPAQE
jgi:hypothetical protein